MPRRVTVFFVLVALALVGGAVVVVVRGVQALMAVQEAASDQP